MIDKKKEFYEYLIELINPDIEVESGNDDCIYGKYVDWPPIRNLDELIIIDLLEYFGLSFPFGEKNNLSDLVKEKFLSNIPKEHSSIKSDIMSKIEVYEYDEEIDIWSLSIQFPEFDEIKNEIADLLSELGVPEGQKYENGGELDNYPDWTRYFAESEYDDYDDYDYYSQFSISYINYKDEMENIKTKLLKYEDDELIVKSMILSAFIHTESFIKSKIVDKIPNIEDSVKNIQFKEMLTNEIEKNLKTTDGRKKLFKKFDDNQNKLNDIPNVELRNILAHDISSPSVKNKKIIFNNNEDNRKELEIELVINELLTYSSKLEHPTN